MSRFEMITTCDEDWFKFTYDDDDLWRRRPLTYARGTNPGRAFRCPHFTVSNAGLVGELALAVNGTLFIEDAGRFDPGSLANMFSVWGNMDVVWRPRIVFHLNTAEESRVDDARIEWLMERCPDVGTHLVYGEVAR